MRLLLLCSLVTGILGTGCAANKYYGVDYALQRKAVLDTQSDAPAPSAATVVKTATTVAFYPPDACREDKAAGAGTTEVSNVLRLTCGVLMAELEAEAGRSGYQVVSWQTLRGNKRPIDFAAENKVDILFEINELSLDIPPQDLYSFSDMQFFERSPQGILAAVGFRMPWEPARAQKDKRPLVVEGVDRVGRRCQERFYGGLKSTVAVTLDVKMVSVVDGRVHWHYRTTKAEDPDVGAELTRTYVAPGETGSPGMLIAGGVLGGLGVAAIITGAALAVGLPGEDAGWITALSGAGALGLGGVFGLIGLVMLFPSWPEPEMVLCEKGWDTLEEQSTEGPASEARAGTSFQATEQVSLGDPVETRRKALLQQVVRGFVDQVRGLKSGAPPPAAPPAQR